MEDLQNTVRRIVTEMMESAPHYRDGLLTKQAAQDLTEKIEAKAREMGVKTVTAIVDDGGNLKFLSRADGAFIASISIAEDKAYTSVALRMPTEQVGAEAKEGKTLDGLAGNSHNRISMLGGGAPLIQGGIIHGGLGVSGGTAEQDTYLAHYGAEIYRTMRR